MSVSKPIIAVVTAVAGSFGEREMLRGVISENQKNGYSTVVISNIYNQFEPDEDLIIEQRIYDLVRSEEIRGIILFSESYSESRLRSHISDLLQERDVPIVLAGAALPEFDTRKMLCLNTSDRSDLDALTSHLINDHGLHQITMLTGTEGNSVSEERAAGYRDAMRRAGLPESCQQVIYGNFWITSGEELADRYIRGEIPLPQAILCANDTMAHGILSRFAANGIRVPEDVTVVSYEYSNRRMYYLPVLTCFRRGREALGRAAAQQLHARISGSQAPDFTPPGGSLVRGSSCNCRLDTEQYAAELQETATQRIFSDYSLLSTMEHKLACCRTMEEFVRIVSAYQWIIRDKSELLLCLYADWYDLHSNATETVLCRTLLPWHGKTVTETSPLRFSRLFELDPTACVCYLLPMFSGQKLFGHMALLYADARSYDDIFRNWLKSVTIGLEFLRLKNDIRYLLSCQSVSEYRDTLTGLYNAKGFDRAWQSAKAQPGETLYCVVLQIFPDAHTLQYAELSQKTDAILAAARAVRKLCGEDAAAHLQEDTFACLLQSRADGALLSDLLGSILLQEPAFLHYAGSDAFACTAIPCEGRIVREVLDEGKLLLDQSRRELQERRTHRKYDQLAAVRDQIYESPEITFEQDRDIIGSDQHDAFRVNYKRCFGISFHQDCIAARIARAKAQLAATDLSIAEIAEQIGYLDQKYFYRQFSAAAGMTAMQFRDLLNV